MCFRLLAVVVQVNLLGGVLPAGGQAASIALPSFLLFRIQDRKVEGCLAELNF